MALRVGQECPPGALESGLATQTRKRVQQAFSSGPCVSHVPRGQGGQARRLQGAVQALLIRVAVAVQLDKRVCSEDLSGGRGELPPMPPSSVIAFTDQGREDRAERCWSV